MFFLIILLTCYFGNALSLNILYQYDGVGAKYSEGLANVNISSLCALEYLGMVWQTSADDVWLSIGNYSVVKYRHPSLLELPPWFQDTPLPKIGDPETLDSLLLSLEEYDPDTDYCALIQQLRSDTIQAMEEFGPVEFLMVNNSFVKDDKVDDS
ncbi:hypothetical protein HYPBUDRAFT_150416 [Hyphopichia burtonii NRRL Y-1933]|uniref:Uncharacterized protein n=1 Tax=Hyphopichia burtonii NRRL Y-1933 TaxID=984485 RepID=A0A1E4REV4_9ASCO|nr:hypothetical protein HYPBUDRAFT_150416 [Hyphopichia burtonii NRRL Y-1933]ODV65797.1 hypothetical protein HYPBUDRAFT_150416 [Hyphopichia burtonii NRRL Y-1933]